MEDAYEIGIRLVLENGVSAGIAALQNDLAVYDRALAATTGRLRAMTEAGRGLAVPVGSGAVGSGATGPAAHGPARRAETAAPDDAGTGRRQDKPTPLPVMQPAFLPPLPVAGVLAPSVPPMADAPVAVAAAIVVLVQLQASAPVFEARTVVRHRHPKLFTRPPPAGC